MSGPWRMSCAWWGREAWSYTCWDVEAERSRPEGLGKAARQAPAQLSCRLQYDHRSRDWRVEALYD